MIGLGLYYPSLLGDYHILGIPINQPLQMDFRGFRTLLKWQTLVEISQISSINMGMASKIGEVAT
jgi:hypothetical protein